MPTEESRTCDHCGKEFTAKRKNARFCGRSCWMDFHNYNRNHTPLHHLYHNAKKRAKGKGVPFEITKDDIVVPEFCPVLGIKLERGRGARGYIDSSPSLDRIVPELGYVPGNVAVISMRANRIKNDATAEELAAVLAFVKKETACVRSENSTYNPRV